MHSSYVYIITNKKDGVLYIGVTSDLVKRIYEHKNGIFDGFSKKYNLDTLVYFEVYEGVHEAITREKQVKEWNRDWKVKLIEENNPDWNDLYLDLF
jgi:putative endonuclease